MTGTSGGQRSGRRPSTVWYLDDKGKLAVTFIRPGVSDSTYTEILRSDLKEGQQIITGTESAQSTTSTSTAGGPPRGYFMPR
jgi:HlyD family secretion protein